MTSTFRALIVLSTVSILGACASTPDPAEVCSAEWIAPRTESAIAKIQKRASSSMKTLTKTSQTLAAGKEPGLFQKLALVNALSKMKKELTSIKTLKTVATTCNDPKIIGDSMRSLMQRQGMTDSFIGKIEANPIYQSIISSISKPEPVNPNG